MFLRIVVHRLLPVFILMRLDLPSFAQEVEELKQIDAVNAAAHAGEHVIVKMTVNASRLLRDRDIGFLNSEKDYMDEDNFTVVLYEKVLNKFAEQEIDDPCKHFRGKMIEVTGGIELRRGKPQIVLKSPEDIKLIEADSKGDDAG